jgi:hypothetical protein
MINDTFFFHALSEINFLINKTKLIKQSIIISLYYDNLDQNLLFWIYLKIFTLFFLNNMYIFLTYLLVLLLLLLLLSYVYN